MSSISDRKYNGGLLKLAADLEKPLRIIVGIQGKEAGTVHPPENDNGKTASIQTSSLTVVELAAIHEFGLGNVPSRSWLRAWFDEQEDKLQTDFKRGFQAYIAGKIDRIGFANAFGLRMVSSILRRWTRVGGITPPLKDATIQRKGSSMPLIDTGVMKSSVTYLVVDSSGGSASPPLSGGVSL